MDASLSSGGLAPAPTWNIMLVEGYMSRIIAACALLVVLTAACTPRPSLPHTDLPTADGHTGQPPAAPSPTATSSILSDEALAAELGAYMEQQAANLSFSGAALVARRGNVLLQKGYGAASRRWKRPNTEHTQFRIASISKEFTAVAILLLQAQGKLDVHDHMCVYMPDCPPAWADITLHQLLTHTSGIPNDSDLPEYTSYQATPAAPAELMQRLVDLPLEFPPGETWKYSNSGYLVLGTVIEQASGLPYEQFLEENIFTPLGMTNTGILGATHLASGYANCCDLTPADTSDPTVDYAAGGLYSTVGDLYIWDQALFDDQFLSPDLRKMAFTPYEYMTDFGGLSYGYGCMVGEMVGHHVVGHTGRLEGYLALNFYFPDEQVAVILLANQRNPPVTSIFTQLASMVLKPAY